MSSTRPRPISAASSLLQDVPGAFPVRAATETADEEELQPPPTLSEAVFARRAEYVRPQQVRIKVGTWNVAARKGTDKDIGGWFVQGKGLDRTFSGLDLEDKATQGPLSETGGSIESRGEDRENLDTQHNETEAALPPEDGDHALPSDDDIGLYVLGLQEVVDISSATEALRPYTDTSVAKMWRNAMETALPKGYQLVAEQQLIGLLLLVYASPDIAKEVKSVSTTSVGTGLMGYMGNKGAVTARIVLGETTRLVFVNSHLAAGADKTALERRNWDSQQIVQRTRFEPIRDSMGLAQMTGEELGDEDFAFWTGDLNYRIEGIPGNDVRRLLALHTRNEYDLNQRATATTAGELERSARNAAKKRLDRSSTSTSGSSSFHSPRSSDEDPRTSTDSTAPSTLVEEPTGEDDPSSLRTTLLSLFSHDELQQQMKARKAFHDGWQEGPITFLPTYKYDVGSVGVFDSSEKKRAPSWCDRILYRTRKDKLAYDAKILEEKLAREKDAEMKANGTDQAGDDDQILYDYDPEMDGANNNDAKDEYDEYDEADDAVVTTKEGFNDEIYLEHYTAHQHVLSSDHKPLNAVFLLRFDAVVQDLKAKVIAEVAKDLDKAENENRPNVTVVVDKHHEAQTEQSDNTSGEFEGIWFDSVRWGQAKHRNVTIANTSRVPASISFVERPATSENGTGIAPSWLKLKLNGSVLQSSSTATEVAVVEPGETANLELELRILNMSIVQELNEGVKSLEDILVLRVEGGRDHFIPVRARWLATSLTQAVDKLIRVPEGGIRKLQDQKPDGNNKKRSSSSKSNEHAAEIDGAVIDEEEPVRVSAPRELFRLTESIEELCTRVVAEWNMLASTDTESAPWTTHPAWPFDERCWTESSDTLWQDHLSKACDALDSDQQLEAALPDDMAKLQRLYVLANLMMIFLQSMPDGIVGADMWAKIEVFLNDVDKAKKRPSIDSQRISVSEILSTSPSHNISLVLVTTMLERITVELSETARADRDDLRHHAGPVSPLRKIATLGKASAPKQNPAINELARLFADAVIRTSEVTERSKPSRESRKVDFIKLLLIKDEG